MKKRIETLDLDAQGYTSICISISSHGNISCISYKDIYGQIFTIEFNDSNLVAAKKILEVLSNYDSETFLAVCNSLNKKGKEYNIVREIIKDKVLKYEKEISDIINEKKRWESLI